MSHQQHPLPDLAGAYRELYRAKFRADMQAGTATPFLVPLHLFAYWVVPTLYLAIPHRNSPWLYRARWLVLAFVFAFHWYMIRHVRSLSFVASYGTGIVAAWATVWNLTLLVWTRPQWDAKRVERRRKIRHVDRREPNHGLDQPLDSSKPDINHSSGRTSISIGKNKGSLELDMNGATTSTGNKVLRTNGDEELLEGVRKRETLGKRSTTTEENTDLDVQEGLLMREIVALNERDGNPPLDRKTALKLCRLARDQEYEYYWQDYPAHASFWTRLDWAFDIVSSLRLTGWNWAPSCLPPYEPPPEIGPYQLPLEYGPQRSKQGYERILSRREFILTRWLFNLLPSYMTVDLCATLMTMDPYFIIGPEHNEPLPMHLASLDPVLLSLLRTILAFAGIISALQLVWNFGALLLAVCCPPILGFRAHPWHLPSMFGSFMQVLDQGLGAFWGDFWHQSFRVGFSAPTKWLLRRGYLPSAHKDSDSGGGGKRNESGNLLVPLTGAIIAFVQSGLIHAAASYTTLPTTHPYGPPLFFFLSGLGTMAQLSLSRLLRRRIEKPPRWVRRLGNLSFVFLWLWATGWTLLDDFGRCGIWLWEPVPVSLARAAGLGSETDRRVWRFDWDSVPRWHWGSPGRWWETGIAL